MDYDEIRRIIREEVSNAAGFMKHLNMQEGRTPGDGNAGVRGVLKGVRHAGDEHVQDQVKLWGVFLFYGMLLVRNVDDEKGDVDDDSGVTV